NLAVDDPLRLHGPHAARGVAVVDDDVRDAAGVRDAREERHVPLATALEHERERQLLGASLDEHRAAREEELGAVAVELRERAERLGLGQRLWLEEGR